jgi:nucleoside-diphosphate kinase
MFDIKNQKLFLKRTVEKTFDLNLMFIGARVNIFSRLLTVVDYGDVFTRKRLEGQKEKTFAMIKPNSYLEIG